MFTGALILLSDSGQPAQHDQVGYAPPTGSLDGFNLRLDENLKRLFMRLDKRVAEQFSLSRRGATAAVRRGQVDVGGVTCVDPAREVEAETPLAYKPGRLRPKTTARRLSVLYEDREVLVVDKPAGLLTQPTPAREPDTLLDRAGRYLAQHPERDRPYVGIVHRLDRSPRADPSGLFAPSAAAVSKALSRYPDRTSLSCRRRGRGRTRERHDRPAAGGRPRRRPPGCRPRNQPGVPAVTHYQVLERFGTACHPGRRAGSKPAGPIRSASISPRSATLW